MCFEVQNSRLPFFSYQSLLLKTNALNDRKECLCDYMKKYLERECELVGELEKVNFTMHMPTHPGTYPGGVDEMASHPP